MLVPTEPKLYHIVHADRLSRIIKDQLLWSDAQMIERDSAGTIIGMAKIKQRRLTLPLASRPGLSVGDCVPFYFCPRSVMLYVIHMANHPELEYRGGQRPIVHLEADLHQSVAWANSNERRWAFTSSNAGSYHFDDYSDIGSLNRLDWQAIEADDWRECREGKQAEFLFEGEFPWGLISRIGVHSRGIGAKVQKTLQASRHRPRVMIKPNWYYG